MPVVPRGWRRARPSALAHGLLVAAAVAGGGSPALASGVDGAGRIVVVPLAFSGPDRESVITLNNPGPAPLKIATLYVGMDATPLAGSHACLDQSLPPTGSLPINVRDLCGLPAMPDAENIGYLQMTASGDGASTFFASSVVLSAGGEETSAIAGEPMGAYTPGWPNSYVLGLRTEEFGQPGV